MSAHESARSRWSRHAGIKIVHSCGRGFEPVGEPENHPFTKNSIQESSDTKSDHSRSFFMVRDLADLHATEIRVYNF
jgi:hypothetical protein